MIYIRLLSIWITPRSQKEKKLKFFPCSPTIHTPPAEGDSAGTRWACPRQCPVRTSPHPKGARWWRVFCGYNNCSVASSNPLYLWRKQRTGPSLPQTSLGGPGAGTSAKCWNISTFGASTPPPLSLWLAGPPRSNNWVSPQRPNQSPSPSTNVPRRPGQAIGWDSKGSTHCRSV